MNFLDYFKVGRLKKFTGLHEMYVDLFYEGETKNYLVIWTYDGAKNTFDVDFVGAKKGGIDIWDQVGYRNQYHINSEIQSIITKWARSVGISHPYL